MPLLAFPSIAAMDRGEGSDMRHLPVRNRNDASGYGNRHHDWVIALFLRVFLKFTPIVFSAVIFT